VAYKISSALLDRDLRISVRVDLCGEGGIEVLDRFSPSAAHLFIWAGCCAPDPSTAAESFLFADLQEALPQTRICNWREQ